MMDRDNMMKQQKVPDTYIDGDRLHTLICLESLLESCYQALAGLVHNTTIRQECQQMAQHARNRCEDLRRTFFISSEGEHVIEEKISKYILEFKPLHLPLRSIFNLAINLVNFKLDIYKYFARTNPPHREFLNDCLEDTAEEMDFLCHEKEFHQNRLNDYLKV